MKKTFFSLVLSLLLILPAFSMALPAQAVPDLWGGSKDGVQTELGYDSNTESDPRIVAASIIKIFMSFLGIIAVVLIIWGGFRWMTAGGNDDSVGEAKKIITQAVIGLVIILAAWALANWVIETVNNDVLG